MNLQQATLRARGAGVVSGLPQLGLALTCLAGLLVPRLAATLAPRIGHSLVIEFMAIHAFVPLGGLALWRPKRWWTQTIRFAAFAGFAYLYSTWVWEEIVSFWMLTGATWLGFFLHDDPARQKKALFTRWLVNAFSFLGILFVVLVSCDVLGIHSPRRELLVGLVFFAAMASLEMTPLYDMLIPGAPLLPEQPGVEASNQEPRVKAAVAPHRRPLPP